MKRCFVALDVSAKARERLHALSDEMRRLSLPRGKLRPVPNANLHLTVKFLGATPDAMVAEIVDHLAQVASHTPRVEVVAMGLSAFPSVERPRVVYAGVGEGNEHAIALARSVDHAVAPLGFDMEIRAHTPHVTLARVQGAGRNSSLTNWLRRHANCPVGPVQADRLILYESVLGPHRAEYEILARLPLVGSR